MSLKRTGHGTHIVPLVRAFELSEGDILELGTGHFSTGLLSGLCDAYRRKLVSYENDSDWVIKMRPTINERYHTLVEAKKIGDVSFNDRHWGLVLVDNAPAEERAPAAIALKDHADFIILHDAEPKLDNYYKYSEVYPHFKYVYLYTKVIPWTAVISNFKEFKP